jgi:hypothetical protein
MADGEVSFNITPMADGQATRLETFVGGESVSWVELDGHGLDWLIGQLAAARANLAEPVIDAFDPATQPAAIEDPAWWVSDPNSSGSTLALRHPGVGWLSFHMPRNEAAELARWLSGPVQP